MTAQEIIWVREKFDQFSDMDYCEFLYEPVKANWLTHKEEDYFKLIIFPDSQEVYQGGTEADTIGVELKTYEDLEVRYKSMTGLEM